MQKRQERRTIAARAARQHLLATMAGGFLFPSLQAEGRFGSVHHRCWSLGGRKLDRAVEPPPRLARLCTRCGVHMDELALASDQLRGGHPETVPPRPQQAIIDTTGETALRNARSLARRDPFWEAEASNANWRSVEFPRPPFLYRGNRARRCALVACRDPLP